MVPYSLLQPRSSVSFEDKLKFSTIQRLSLARSKLFTVPETDSHSSARSIEPLDYSLKLYKSPSDPRNKEKKRRSNLAAPRLCETMKRTSISLPNVKHEGDKSEVSPKFITSYRPPDALDTKLMFLKAGKHLAGPYKNPEPNYFRLLDENLPDIVTTHEKDPGNLNFKLKHLDIIRTAGSESDSSSRDTQEEVKHKTGKAYMGCEACSPKASLASK
ncbi:putative uncharacterized protein C7orf78 homolog [Clinocottus analis]|uniref:putative uncharacterized protein C7orf78 homolog n=1 Tax=Clinocottus analis TaxID=304258 RepID=UPI0035C17FDD